MSVINPKTQRSIKIGGGIYNKLIRESYVYDGTTNALIEVKGELKNDAIFELFWEEMLRGPYELGCEMRPYFMEAMEKCEGKFESYWDIIVGCPYEISTELRPLISDALRKTGYLSVKDKKDLVVRKSGVNDYVEGVVLKRVKGINASRLMFIMRGPSGLGKSTFTTGLVDRLCAMMGITGDERLGCISSTDSYLMSGGVYNFRVREAVKAHDENYARVCGLVSRGHKLIVVDNTNLSESEYGRYVFEGRRGGYEIFMVDVGVIRPELLEKGCLNRERMLELSLEGNERRMGKSDHDIGQLALKILGERFFGELTLK